jgi:hypothetical protein
MSMMTHKENLRYLKKEKRGCISVLPIMKNSGSTIQKS